MAYLYAALGVMMLTGIMAIFEMGLSLTGQSLLPVPSDAYFLDDSMKTRDSILLEAINDEQTFLDVENEKTFSDLASDANVGLCGALKYIEDEDWSRIRSGEADDYFAGSCQLIREGNHRTIIRENDGDSEMPYQLFSCALGSGESSCSFE